MALIFNVHTPAVSYALPYRKNESSSALVDRILRKSGLDEKARAGVTEGREGGLLQYEYEGGRWTLQDEDDLEIMLSRYPVDETPSITLHLTPPKNTGGQQQQGSNSLYSSPPREREKKPNGILNTGSLGRKSNGNGNGNGNGHIKTLTPEKPVHEDIHHKSKLHTVTAPSIHPDNTQASAIAPTPPTDLLVPSAPKSRGARSTSGRSTATAMTSRPKSVHPTTGAIQGYEDDEDVVEGETLGDKHKRKWKAFHEGRGVRTVVGSIGGVKDVRMLIKLGYRHVYVSRPFATRSGLIPKNSAMGTYGYAGLVNLGQLPITVGSKTEKHTVMISEEVNFDVVLGRSWMEKMAIKTDPLDQTHISYYDSNEVIPCDIVVLKDANGQVITVT